MKKIFILFSLMVFFSLSANAANRYYCPLDQNEQRYSPSNIYETNLNCEWNVNPDVKQKCYKHQAILKARFDEGLCLPTKLKTHMINGCKCSVEINPIHKILYSRRCTCIGGKPGSASEARIELDRMYAGYKK